METEQLGIEKPSTSGQTSDSPGNQGQNKKDLEKPARQDENLKETVGAEEKQFGRAESTQKDTAENRKNRAEQHEMLKAVGSYFGTAHIGQVVVNQGGGTQYSTTLGPPQVISYQITQEEIDRIVYVYEIPPGYEAAHKQFISQHIIILQGPIHVGKHAAGIKLAVDTLGAEACIEELSQDANLLDRIKPEYIKPDTAYLVDGLLGSRAEKLAERDWEILGERLRNQTAYLVVCVTSDIRLANYANANLCHTIRLPKVTVSRLVEKHIEYMLSGSDDFADPESIRQCLENEQVRLLMEGKLDPERIFHLSILLTQYLKGECPLEEIIQKYSVHSEKIVQEWFEECGDDLDERAYRIALAVLNGARVNSIDIAARNLSTRLKTPPEFDIETTKEIIKETTKETIKETRKEVLKELPIEAPIPASPFSRPRSPRLERSRAHIETVNIPTEYSDNAEVKIICLNDQNYQYALIKYLWEEYGSFQDTFLDWLSDLAVRYDADIRERAAAAVGALARIDFESIRLRVLVKWAFKYDGDRKLAQIPQGFKHCYINTNLG